MGGWLWLIVFGAFFYFMMRFGCGAHMVHGGHKGHGAGENRGLSPGIAVAVAAKDPVCGMEVEPSHGYSEACEGREYHFCSRKCLDKFDADPEHYVS